MDCFRDSRKRLLSIYPFASCCCMRVLWNGVPIDVIPGPWGGSGDGDSK